MTITELKEQPAIKEAQQQYAEKGKESIFERELYAAFSKAMEKHAGGANVNIRIIADAMTIILIGRLNDFIQEETKRKEPKTVWGRLWRSLVGAFTGR